MGKIVCLMGKSSTGKDTILQLLFSRRKNKLHKIIPYTTRPIRAGETHGKDYFFVDEEGYLTLREEKKIIEERAYDTVHGIWRYFTVADQQFSQKDWDYCLVGTLEMYHNLCSYFGKERVLPVLVDLEDGERLQRALLREKQQEHPKYQEMCRRFLADSEDFSEENIKKAGIEKRFFNEKLEECVSEIEEYLKSQGIQ